MIYKYQKISLSFWNFTYKDKRDEQKCHLTLKFYGGWKAIDFGDTEDIKNENTGAYLQILKPYGFIYKS